MKPCSSGSFAIARRARVVLALAGTVWLGCSMAEGSADVHSLATADRQFVGDDGHAVGPAGERELPDRWSMRQRRDFAAARYATRFQLDTVPEVPWSVYLARADTNAMVSVNGVSLGGVGRLEPPLSRMRFYPMLRDIPPEVLRRGVNEIAIALYVEPTSGGSLSKIEVGPKSILAGRHAVRHFLQITWLQISGFCAAILIVVVAAVYGGRGRGTSYRWFQVSVGLWILFLSENWIIDAPIAPQYWEAATNGAFYLAIWAILLGFHRALEGPRPRIELGILIGIVLAIASLALAPAHWVWLLRAAFGVGICLVAVYSVKFLKGTEVGQEWVLNRHQLAGGVVGILAGVHDIASGPYGWPLSGYWLVQHAGSFAVFFFLGGIVRHLVMSVRESSLLGRDLGARVADHEAELAGRFARIRAMESARMLDKERARLTRGLHEGVGSVLMSTIASVEARDPEPRGAPAVVADRIRDALDDLRLVIDSLRPDEALLDMLARLRSRLAARFDRRGIQIAWRVNDIPMLRGFEPEHALVLLRILQDAFRATERAGGVRVVTVRTGSEERNRREGIYVEIEDDGGTAGTPSEVTAMRERATTIGGEITIAHEDPATRTRLWLPVDLPEVSRA